MTHDLAVDEVVALILDEYKYNRSFTPKEIYKLLYFAEKEIEKERISTDMQKFWYMFGTMTATSDTAIETSRDGKTGTVSCGLTVDDIDAPESTIRHGRDAVNRALDQYYNLRLGGITDKMYKEAPYEVQRHYRRLDKQLDAAADTGQMTLDGGKNKKRTRETMSDLVESFPLEDYPEYEDDLYIWYRLLSAKLDSSNYDPDEAKKLTKKFWRLFCLELACRENDGLTRDQIADELNIDSIESKKREIRSELLSQEREKSRRNARNTPEAIKASEAFVIPYLDFEVTT